MRKERAKEIKNKLMLEIEEEEIGISLYSALYPQKNDLRFFKNEDRERVAQILKRISDDSERHKVILEKIIMRIGERHHAG